MCIKKEAISFLQTLVGKPLFYGLKSPDTDLYDFGFGEPTAIANLNDKKREVCTHILHVMCRFEIIWKNGECRTDKYYEDTPYEKFHSDIKHLVGLKVTRVALSEKNDLWLDFGHCWVVFATFENGEESWRYFTVETSRSHLVVADSWLMFQ